MKNNIQVKLGQRIKFLRKIKGYSQEFFAEKVGIATKSLSSIETGNAFMTSQTLEKIIDVLEIVPSELFTFQEQLPNDDMYSYILKKLEFIKNDDERLKIFYNFAKSLY
jgi:transcriptional regulator with XRE-family HTH domain